MRNKRYMVVSETKNHGAGKKPLVFLSAGGTAGHVTPAIALAKYLKSKNVDVEWIIDHRAAQRFSDMLDGSVTHVIRSGTGMKGLFKLLSGTKDAVKLLKHRKPDIVVGFGGYPSAPGVFAAQYLGIPSVLHEQNGIIGRANVLLGLFAKKVAFSFDNTEGFKKKRNVTGNPVRPEIVALHDIPYPLLDDQGPINIVVMGGSLGAKVLSNEVPKAIQGLPDHIRKRVNIMQQCRPEDVEPTTQAYTQIPDISSEVAGRIDTATALEKAHLFIGRSGASTVCEMSVAGVPAIYVPYPHHKDQQQKKNAQSVEAKGGAWIIDQADFTAERLRADLVKFFETPDILRQAAASAKTCGKPNAAQALGDLVLGAIDRS